MKIYMVGGAVRDMLQNQSPMDTDFVVVGATDEQMLALGYRRVGKDFSVWHHPVTHDEYALARTERKTGTGYNGFTTETRGVTLEEDLSRRDLTINAMALDENYVLTDPFGGKADLEAKLLRHVSDAFAEDPVRVLRVARFMARFGPEWTISSDTWYLMHDMVANGTMDELAPERVWVEIERGLRSQYPELMLQVLRKLKLLERPSMREYAGGMNSDLKLLEKAAAREASLATLFALAFPRQWDGSELKTSRIPKEIRDVNHTLQVALARGLAGFNDMSAEQRFDLLASVDAFRQSDRMIKVINVLQLLQPDLVWGVCTACATVSTINRAQVLAGATNAADMKQRLRAASIAAIEKLM